MKNQYLNKSPVNVRYKSGATVLFFALSYIISWSMWILSSLLDIRTLEIAGRFSPLVSAIVIVGFTSGKLGLRKLFGKLFVKRIKVKWYIFSMFAPVAIVLPAVYFNQLITGIKPNYNDPNEWYLIIIAFLYVLFLSVLGEETGWRGFALPRLLKRYNTLTASLIIGVLWGIWHLPLFFMEGEFHQTIPFWLFMIDSIALSVIMTWLYVNTNGSLLIVHLFHTASNVTLGVLPILPMDTNGDMGALYIAIVILVIIATVVAICIKEKDYIKSEVKNEE